MTLLGPKEIRWSALLCNFFDNVTYDWLSRCFRQRATFVNRTSYSHCFTMLTFIFVLKNPCTDYRQKLMDCFNWPNALLLYKNLSVIFQ